MNRPRALIRVTGAIFLVLAVSQVAVRVASSNGALSGMLIFTQVPVDAGPGDTTNGSAWWFPTRSRIVAVDPASAERDLLVLTEQFHSARAPAISPDGQRMVFSARRTAEAPWHIWEMTLRSRRVRPITTGSGIFTEPAYLADGRVVFSGIVGGEAEAGRETVALYTAGRDDGPVTRITFHPGTDLAPQVMADGLVLFTSAPDSASQAGAKLMMVRSDGTGVQLFYGSRSGHAPAGRAWETSDGQVVFVESGREHRPGGKLVSVSKKRPLHSRIELSERMEGNFHSVYPLQSGPWLVSYRPPGGERFSLHEFDPVGRSLGRMIADDPGYHAVEPVVAAARPRAKTFVSVTDPGRATGEVYCLDANFSSVPPAPMSRAPLARLVRVRGPDGVLGEVPLAQDGSFYLELPADTPVRLETVDQSGGIVRGPSAWFWVRPNERRGCIGCHEDPELAPENRVPVAVTNPPVPLASARTRTPVAGAGRKAGR